MTVTVVAASRVASVAVTLMGIVVLIGWFSGMPALTTLGLPGPTVKTNTAIALTAGALATLLLSDRRRRRPYVVAAGALAALQALIGGLTFSEHLIGWDLGIDQLLATETAGAAATTSPNRMGPPASSANMLLGIALLLSGTTSPGLRRASHLLAAITCVISILPLLGFAYGVTALYGIAQLTGIALSTAAALFLLSFAVLASMPDRGIVALLSRRDEVGTHARSMLSVAVLLPLGMGWLLARALHSGTVEGAFAISVMALVLMVGPAALIWRTGTQLAASLDARLATERALSEADREKTEFLATLSHELRNPLAPIRFALELLHGPPEVSDRARQTIGRQVAHLTRLIDDLLDLTRITRNKLQLHVQPILASIVIGDAVDAVRGEAARAPHQLDLELPRDPVWLNADPDRVVQIMTNLLTNALRYTEPGGMIRVGARTIERQVELFVRDTGVGIATEDLQRVFDRFVQVGHARHGGLGIGLALVKGLAELHGGRVEAWSAGIGHGAEFRVRLPRADAPASTIIAPAPALQPERLRILIVDDNVDAAEMLRTLLVQLSHDVCVAHSGEDGLAQATARRPHVGLLDIGMPGMNGYELAGALRRDAATAGMFLVAITGWGQEEDRRRAMASGFDAHLTKPADPDVLLRLVAERFGERSA